jgi:signal transduction histidine kinase/ligand-binding sensor domain-containing protein
MVGNMKKGVWFVLQLIICTGFAQVHELKFNLVEGEGGNPLGKITSIVQDTYGYMWFAGESERCLYRYDGIRMVKFIKDDKDPNSLGGSRIFCLAAADSGGIWIGFHGDGLDYYNPTTGGFTHYRHDPNDPQSIASDHVDCILQDSRGRILVGTDGMDVMEGKSGKFKHYRNDPGDPGSLSNNVVNRICEDHQGVIWVGTGFPFYIQVPEEGGLNRFNSDGSFTRFLHDPEDPGSLIDNKVTALLEDSRGIFWVGTKKDGLHTMDRTTGRFQRHLFDLKYPGQLSLAPLQNPTEFASANNTITFIQEDHTGAVWIGNLFAGIIRYDPISNRMTNYSSSNGFPDKSAWTAFVSRDGTLWISTEEEHLYRVDPFYKTITGTPTSDQPYSFQEDNAGFLWVGTTGGGLLKFNKYGELLNQFKHKPSEPISLFDAKNNVLSLFHSLGDTMWIGTSDGPGFLNMITGHFYRLPGEVKYAQNVVFKNVPDVLQDKGGLLWFVMNGNGLLRYHPGNHSFRHYKHDAEDPSSLSSNDVVCVFEDKSGNLWVGDRAGSLNRLKRETDRFSHYLEETGVHKLFEDSAGRFWAGTDNGLFLYSKSDDRFLSFFNPQHPELASFEVLGMIEDHSRNLWIYSTNAIIRLNPLTKETFIYSGKFGIRPNSLNPLGFYKTRKGQLLLGHEKGFYSFYPEELSVKIEPLNIVITGISVNNLPLDPDKKENGQKPLEELDELVLNHLENNISFDFASTDYRSPEKTQYFTQLENFDDTWRESINEKRSYYFHVAPGKYIYRIRAYNSEGTVGDKEIRVQINPPWWQTRWAYGLYSIMLTIAIIAIYRYQKQNIIRRERQKAQKKELAQAKEIEKAYAELQVAQTQLIQAEKMASLGELTSGIAHEIKNPLNFINNFSEINLELISEIEQDYLTGPENEQHNGLPQSVKYLKKNSEKINHHGKRIDEIVKGMLQHSRMGDVSKEMVNINAICEEALKLAYHGFRAKEKGFQVSVETRLDASMPRVVAIPHELSRVLLNLINNALYTVHLKEVKNREGVLKDTLQVKTLYIPSVIVSTQYLGNKISIKISDNGMGIREDIIGKIFQPFFTTKPTGEGTGLGLSMAYDIITKGHGGELKVKSKEGIGSDFEIILPADATPSPSSPSSAVKT